MPEPVDCLFSHCHELLTLRDGSPHGLRRHDQLSSVGCLVDGAIAVRDGRIVAVGQTAELRSRFAAERETDLSGFVVLPGFVDAHTRPVFPASVRVDGVTEDRVVQALRDSSTEELRSAITRHLDVFLSHGTTTVEAKTGYGLSVEAEVRGLEALTAASADHALTVHRTFFGAGAMPVEHRGARQGYVREIVDHMLPAVRGLAESCGIHAEPDVFERRQVIEIMERARAEGLSLRISTDRSSIGGAELAVELGAASADYLERVSLGGQQRLADSSTAAVLLPTAAMAQGGKHAPARAMIERGCGVVLASGFGPHGEPSIPMVIGLGVAVLRMSVEECVNAVTINAASSLGMDEEVGSLHTGKRANFVALDLPSYGALGQLRGGNPVALTVVDGEPVVANLTEWQPATW